MTLRMKAIPLTGPSRTTTGADSNEKVTAHGHAVDGFSLWRAFGRRLQTTSGGVELAILRGFTGLRLVNAGQMSLAVVTLVHRSPRPVLDVALAVAFLTESVVLIVTSLRRGTLRHRPSVWLDTMTGVGLLAGQPFIASSGNLINTWDAWGYAVTLSCALLVGISLPRSQACAAVTVLSLTYLIASEVGVDEGQRWTAVTNALGYTSFALVGWLIASYLRRLGADADLNRQLAEQRGRELERERTRRLLHDHAGLLTMIGHGNQHPELAETLTRQALHGAAKVIAFMATAAGIADDGQARTLRTVVLDAAHEFPDLPLTVNADLAEHVTLTADMAQTVAGAVVTLLYNVRHHAHAAHCTLHADANADTRASGAAPSWEVVVHDDGVGFDPAQVSPGYGLSRQVRLAARAAGIGVRVSSSPGDGTRVTLTWPGPPEISDLVALDGTVDVRGGRSVGPA